MACESSAQAAGEFQLITYRRQAVRLTVASTNHMVFETCEIIRVQWNQGPPAETRLILAVGSVSCC
jgi:hypothetical protein